LHSLNKEQRLALYIKVQAKRCKKKTEPYLNKNTYRHLSAGKLPLYVMEGTPISRRSQWPEFVASVSALEIQTRGFLFFYIIYL